MNQVACATKLRYILHKILARTYSPQRKPDAPCSHKRLKPWGVPTPLKVNRCNSRSETADMRCRALSLSVASSARGKPPALLCPACQTV